MIAVLRRTGLKSSTYFGVASREAYVGAWIHHGKCSIVGATLTVPPHTGRIFTATLALLVGVTGGHFWSLVCCILHQLRTTCQSKDGFYHQ
ncbi:hypothetical protein B0J14DRAFT_592692 [Halenospora varia]|nr:hypothetical protein B0J14DRAFT_592692 [Halenospora varia]